MHLIRPHLTQTLIPVSPQPPSPVEAEQQPDELVFAQRVMCSVAGIGWGHDAWLQISIVSSWSEFWGVEPPREKGDGALGASWIATDWSFAAWLLWLCLNRAQDGRSAAFLRPLRWMGWP